jgi:hypothetical protein
MEQKRGNTLKKFNNLVDKHSRACSEHSIERRTDKNKINLSTRKAIKFLKATKNKYGIYKITSIAIILIVLTSIFMINRGPLTLTASAQTINDITVTGPSLLQVNQIGVFTANFTVPTHTETYRDLDFWTTHTRIVPDYEVEKIVCKWFATPNQDINLNWTDTTADFTFTKLTTSSVTVYAELYYEGQTIGQGSTLVAPASQPETLQVNVTTNQGPNPKLSPNQICTITATPSYRNQYDNETVPAPTDEKFTYTWKLTPHDEVLLLVDGNQKEYPANQTFTLSNHQPSLTIAYASASAAEVWIHCDVTDKNGSTAGDSIVIVDPYTQPELHLINYGAPYSYLITTDGLGWYQAINGTTGLNEFTSPNWATTVQQANDVMDATGGKLAVAHTESAINVSTVVMFGSGTDSYVRYEIDLGNNVYQPDTAWNGDLFTTKGQGTFNPHDIQLYNFKIDGDADSHTNSSANAINFVSYQGSLTNFEVTDWQGNAIRFAAPPGDTSGGSNAVSHGRITYCTGNGAVTEHYGSDIKIDNVKIYYNDVTGIYQRAGHISVHQCSIFTNGGYGIDGATWAEIDGNWISSNALGDVYLDESSSNAAGHYGNALYEISDNYFGDASRESPVPMIAISAYVTGTPAKGATITGNTFDVTVGKTSYAIALLDSAQNNTIVGNSLCGNPEPVPFLYQGPDTVGNVVANNGGVQLGKIAYPVLNGHLVDSTGTGTINNATNYICDGTAKTIQLRGGNITGVALDGDIVWTSTDTNTIVYSGHSFCYNCSTTNIAAYSTGDDVNSVNIYSGTLRGQTFTVGANDEETNYISLYMKRSLGTTGNVNISIYATDGSLPTGNVLSSVVVPLASLTTLLRWENFTLPSTLTLSAGTVYAVTVAVPDGDVSNYVTLRADSSSPTYTGGSVIRSSNGGSSWSAAASQDFLFAIETTVPTVIVHAP